MTHQPVRAASHRTPQAAPAAPLDVCHASPNEALRALRSERDSLAQTGLRVNRLLAWGIAVELVLIDPFAPAGDRVLSGTCLPGASP